MSKPCKVRLLNLQYGDTPEEENVTIGKIYDGHLLDNVFGTFADDGVTRTEFYTGEFEVIDE